VADANPFESKRNAHDQLSQAGEEIRAAIEKAKSVLPSVASSDREEFGKWVIELLGDLGVAIPNPKLPGVSRSIRDLLRLHPNGLRMADIEEQLKGQFITVSTQWRNAIQSAVMRMRLSGEIIWSTFDRQRHRLNPNFVPGKPGRKSGEEPVYRRVIRHMHTVKRPVTIAEVATVLGIPHGSVKSAIHDRKKNWFVKVEDDGYFKWTLNPKSLAELREEAIIK
jgi:hypothetical protein